MTTSHLLTVTVSSWAIQLADDALAALLGGVALTLVLFLLREKVFPMPSLNGRWFFENYVSETALHPDEGMRLKFEAVIWQEGAVLRGTTEKIYEDSQSDGRRRYDGTDRRRAELSGYITMRYFAPNVARIHLLEDNERRKSTSFMDIEIRSSSFMCGHFSSMIASSSGRSVWSRNRRSEFFASNVREEVSDKFGPLQ